MSKNAELIRVPRADPSGRTVAVDLTGVTAIDGAARYLLRLMEAKSVTLEGGGLSIRALLHDEQGLVQPRPHARIDGSLVTLNSSLK